MKVTENYWKVNIPYVSISLDIKKSSRKLFIEMDCMALKCHLEFRFHRTHFFTLILFFDSTNGIIAKTKD